MTNYENMTEEERMKAYEDRKHNKGEKTMTPNDILKEAFRKVGKNYGYDNVTAEFFANKDFTVRWQRTYKWADFKVSDYLEGAPFDVLESLAETLFRKISGQEVCYSDKMRAYVITDEFVSKTRPTYLRRHSKMTQNPVGEYRDLTESYQRLVDLGLVEADKDMYLTWTTEKLYHKTGYQSSLIKVVAISNSFDDDIVPTHVLDFVVYHHYLLATTGRRNFGRESNEDIDKLEAKFPDHDLALKWLSKMNLYL